ncbi:helix-turn-helix domain-containing protein [Aquimarina muelleri]|uniref:helix-turn-helix domain-containing protein n=1 Tax=Aquimarina muelleri TaxID=279356 RepID=UPI003F686109
MFLHSKFQRIALQNRIKFIGILILIIYYPKVLAQNDDTNTINNTLRNKNYKELSDLFYKNRKEDSIKAKEYAQIYLLKAQTFKDTIKIADGFLLLSRISDEHSQLKYYDSIINLTKYLNHKKYPAEGYYKKGIYFFYRRDFKKSLDLHIEAYSYAKINNPDLAFRINHNIGILRVRLGDSKKALEVFKNSFNYVTKNNYKAKGNTNDYLKTIFSLSNEYRRNHILDSANYYCDLGIQESIGLKNGDYYNFLLTKGILQYETKDYNNAVFNILKAKNFHEKNNNDNPNLAFTYFYYAKILFEKEKINESIETFKKVDSIFQIQNDIHPELRNSYKFIIDFYKKSENQNLQLKYIEQLMKVDSVINSNYKYLNKKINIDYDSSFLILEKEKLINKLKRKKKISVIGYVSLIVIIIIIAILFLYNLKKKKIYKEKFDQLIQEKEISSSQKNLTKANKTISNSEDIGISKEVIHQILSDLDTFVEKEEYLNKNITMVALAKKINTNSKYLSKIINTYKQKSFIHYINDLRIDYTVEKLKKDSKFRKYSIKAISESVGYGKAESFSNAFKRRTGILPSYFIKQLNQKHSYNNPNS